MASERRKEIQSAVADLRGNIEGCSLAMLIDSETGLVLCNSSDTVISQDRLEAIANTGRADLQSPTVSAMLALTKSDGPVSNTNIEEDAITVAIQVTTKSETTAICVFDEAPNPEELIDRSRVVFAITETMEVA